MNQAQKEFLINGRLIMLSWEKELDLVFFPSKVLQITIRWWFALLRRVEEVREA